MSSGPRLVADVSALVAGLFTARPPVTGLHEGASESTSPSLTAGARAPARETSLVVKSRAFAQAIAVALGFFAVAGLFEAALIRAFKPSELELDWVSDVVLSAALGVAVYLWLHLRATRQALTERERSQVVIQTQLAMAEAMQRRLLPEVPAPVNGCEWAAVLTPAGKIGGDFYDFVEAAPGTYLMFLADVSGKGISAAMALTLVRSAFRHVARGTLSPAQVAARLSDVFHDEWHGTPYVTGIVARVATRERQLTYANAGHPPGVLVRDGAGRSLSEGGPPLGLLKDARFEEEHIDLMAGDVCAFVTDGITEAFDDHLQASRTIVAAAAREGARSPSTVCHVIMASAFRGPGPSGVDGWEDDRTVIVVALRDDAPREINAAARAGAAGGAGTRGGPSG